MSPPPPPKSPGVGVGDPLPVVGSDRPQTPVDGGEFLDLLLYHLSFIVYRPTLIHKPNSYPNHLDPVCYAGSWLYRIDHRQIELPKLWKLQGTWISQVSKLGCIKQPSPYQENLGCSIVSYVLMQVHLCVRLEVIRQQVLIVSPSSSSISSLFCSVLACLKPISSPIPFCVLSRILDERTHCGSSQFLGIRCRSCPVAKTSNQEQDTQKSPPRDITSSSPTTVHPLLQVASVPPHSRSTVAAAATTTTSPASECISLPLGSSAQSPTNVAKSASGASEAQARPSSAMIFSDIYKSPRSPIAKLRHHSVQLPTPLPDNTPDWYNDEHADLLSKDKAKQKEAVRRYLDAKIKNDWDFSWPSRVVDPPPAEGDVVVVDTAPGSPDAFETVTSLDVTEPVKAVQDETHEDDGYQVDDPESSDDEDNSDAESIYSTVSEDPVRFRTRLEWTSDLSDDDDEPGPSRSPFRFDNPNNVGPTVQAAVQAKRAKRRRAVRKEMEWNEGLACFEARRNAWTGARTVRIRAKPVTPPAVSPLSPRRFFFRRSMSTSPPSSTIASALPPQVSDASDNSSLARSDELRNARSKDTTPSTPPDSRNYPVEVLLPLAPPLLPPNNPLRASITPSVYLSLYDKVIIHSLQPSCPINLSDMLRACVTGWKRDGEWPPRPTMPPPAPAAKKKKAKKATNQSDNTGSTVRRMSFGLLGRDKDDATNGKGIRRSLVRALGIGETADTPK